MLGYSDQVLSSVLNGETLLKVVIFFFLFLKIMYVTYNLFLGCVWMEGLEGRKRMVYFSFLNYSHYEMFYNKGEGLIYFKKHVL